MKKLLKFLLLSLILFTIMPDVTAKARADTQNEGVNVAAESAYLMEAESGTVIFSKNPKKRLPIASMTKIMLLDLAFESVEKGELDLNEKITVSKNASGMGGSQVFLEEGGEYLVGDLIKSVVVASANDACVALAERLFGSEQAACAAMNNRAQKIGLCNTLFSNTTGLMKPTQYSCAEDVAKMLRSLISHDEYFKFSTIYLDEIEHSSGRKTTLTNTNKLVKFYSGCDGGKTGYTAESGFCLAATAKRGAMRLISVVIKESDGKTRFKDVSLMFDYGFDNYACKTVLDKSVPLEIKVAVKGGKPSCVELLPEKDFCFFGKKNAKDEVKIDFVPDSKIRAPLNVGDAVGKLIVYKNNVMVGEVNAVCSCAVSEKTIFDYVADIASAG